MDDRASSAAHLGPAGAGDDPVAVVEDLYVRQDFREKGIATQLLRRVIKV